MKIESFALGPVMTNAYLAYLEDEKRGIVVDPGMQPQALLRRISELTLNIEAILLTHAHFDHIGGLEEVRSATQAPVYIHATEVDWLSHPNLNGSSLLPGFAPITCKAPEHTLKGGENLTLLNTSFQVVHTPGHSPGSVTYISGNTMFSGDVLFYGSIGRTDLPGGNYATLLNSIRTHLLPLPDSTVVLSGHGERTTIGMERSHNPFLQGR